MTQQVRILLPESPQQPSAESKARQSLSAPLCTDPSGKPGGLLSLLNASSILPFLEHKPGSIGLVPSLAMCIPRLQAMKRLSRDAALVVAAARVKRVGT